MKTLKPTLKTLDTRIGTSAIIRIRGGKLQRIRNRILLRDEYTCQRCGRVSSRLEVDHIVPLHLGGVEADSNRAAICARCHKIKTAEEDKER